MEGTDRIVKGIWFPIEIWEANDLDWNEKILLMEIDSFTSKGMDCFMSNEYIAEFLKVSEWKAGQMVNDLINKGYVIKTKFDGRRRFIESNVRSRLVDFQNQPFEKQKADFGKSIPNYNKYNNDSLQNHQSNNKRFTPPTFDEVDFYCCERGNTIDPQAFIDYYTSNGWKVGNVPMKDWKAAVRTWERREAKTSRPQQKKKESVYEHNNRILAELLSKDIGGQL